MEQERLEQLNKLRTTAELIVECKRQIRMNEEQTKLLHRIINREMPAVKGEMQKYFEDTGNNAYIGERVRVFLEKDGRVSVKR